MELIKMQAQNNIGVITMNSPKTMNAVDVPMVKELLAAFKKFGEDKSIRVIMIAGEGKGFCAGGNVAGMYEKIQKGISRTDDDFHQNVDFLGELARYIREVPKPVIGVLHGPVAGAGASIAMACDFCVAGESVKFIEAFINVGLVPDTAGLFTLVRGLGFKRATQLAMLGEPLSAVDAKAIGMVNYVVADEELWNEANKLAAKLSKKPVDSVINIKRLTNQVMMRGFDDYLKLEKECMMQCVVTDNFAEGVSSFAEKRKAEFNK